MSIKNNTIVENVDFVRRFIEICETNEPAEVSRFLGISYQGAKNYLEGRFPDAKVLITIVEKTQCSLNWLLTGEGEKYLESNKKVNLDETFRAVVREIVREEIEQDKRQYESVKTNTQVNEISDALHFNNEGEGKSEVKKENLARDREKMKNDPPDNE